jgi:hypothetical protein
VTAKKEVTLRIVLEAPPSGVAFGVQKGHGSAYETVQIQQSSGSDLTFEFSVELTGENVDGAADFRGPYVQGPSGGMFVYVDIGTLAGQHDSPWSRRLKIPLTGIHSTLLRRASSGTSQALEARVPGTGRDGTPSCASVKDFRGWKAAR